MEKILRKFIGAGAILIITLVVFFAAASAEAAWKKEGVLLGEGNVKGGLQSEKKLIIPDKQGIIYLYSLLDDSLYLQKLNSKGEKVWGEKGVLIVKSSSLYYSQIVSDGFDGVIVTFQSGNKNYIQRVNKYGKKKWGKNRLIASRGYPSIVSNKNGSVVVNTNDDNYSSVVVKKLNYRGEILWKTILPEAYVHVTQLESMIRDVQDNIYILGYAPSTKANLYKINSQGKVLWSIKTSPNFYVNSRIIRSKDGIIIVGGKWDDVKEKIYKGNLYAQKFDWNGNPKWSQNGVAISDFTNRIFDVFDIVSDKKGGVLIVWQDKRSDERSDIYAQRVNNKGKITWGKTDKLISASQFSETRPRAISDKKGGMVIGWLKNHKTVNFQKINRGGKLLWEEKELASPIVYPYENEMFTLNNKSETIIIAQTGAGKLYAYKLDKDGNILGD